MNSTTDSENLGGSGKTLLLKIAIPVIIGLAVVVWLFSREFNVEALREITVTTMTVAAIAVEV